MASFDELPTFAREILRTLCEPVCLNEVDTLVFPVRMASAIDELQLAHSKSVEWQRVTQVVLARHLLAPPPDVVTDVGAWPTWFDQRLVELVDRKLGWR